MEPRDGTALAVERFWRVVAALDARLSPAAAARSLVDYDSPPAPGDTVLIYDGEHVRAIVFDEVLRPAQPVWIIGVVRGCTDDGVD